MPKLNLKVAHCQLVSGEESVDGSALVLAALSLCKEAGEGVAELGGQLCHVFVELPVFGLEACHVRPQGAHHVPTQPAPGGQAQGSLFGRPAKHELRWRGVVSGEAACGRGLVSLRLGFGLGPTNNLRGRRILREHFFPWCLGSLFPCVCVRACVATAGINSAFRHRTEDSACPPVALGAAQSCHRGFYVARPQPLG